MVAIVVFLVSVSDWTHPPLATLTRHTMNLDRSRIAGQQAVGHPDGVRPAPVLPSCPVPRHEPRARLAHSAGARDRACPRVVIMAADACPPNRSRAGMRVLTCGAAALHGGGGGATPGRPVALTALFPRPVPSSCGQQTREMAGSLT